jgi:hypothetical protein
MPLNLESQSYTLEMCHKYLWIISGKLVSRRTHISEHIQYYGTQQFLNITYLGNVSF